ncbi:hypothetical protein B0H14DRAFT_3423314 [Mycena olivaceomarginata]|nr:hypothetical protein B0H14DRAFT_3423314 [Mycena olivaceomarginata]
MLALRRAPGNDQDVVATAPGSTADCEAWTLVQRLSGLNPKSLLQKTIKNLQAMGTALTWIIESRAFADDLYPLTIRVNDLYQSTHDVAAQAGTLTVAELLRPLSYALNSSFMTVFCDLDLQKEFGNVMNQYETKLFLGRYRTPRLTHSDPDQATPRIISSITPFIRASENEVADVVDSQVDVERENRLAAELDPMGHGLRNP